jgi:Ca2+-binding EF-hand superfamily protein
VNRRGALFFIEERNNDGYIDRSHLASIPRMAWFEGLSEHHQAVAGSGRKEV